MPSQSVRPQFVKVGQRVALLTLERPADVLACPLARGALTDEQVRQMLALRVDFEPDAIMALKL